MRKLARRVSFALVVASIAYLLILAYPQTLFAHELSYGALTVHTTASMPAAMQETLARASTRLQRSALVDAARPAHVFICQDRRLFALFARHNSRVGGVADWLVGQHVFLRESDLEHDRLIGPGGTPVAPDRPLSYFIAHEAMHIAVARSVGRARYSQLPQWVDDGYADYIARDIDLRAALQKMKGNAPELDPRRSGLYLRYHLMVAYLLDKKHMLIDRLLHDPPDASAVERELLQLRDW